MPTQRRRQKTVPAEYLVEALMEDGLTWYPPPYTSKSEAIKAAENWSGKMTPIRVLKSIPGKEDEIVWTLWGAFQKLRSQLNSRKNP